MSKLENILSVTDAMYLRAQQSLRGVLLREAKLRAELRKLDDHAQTVRSEHTATIDKMRGIGADLIWEAWLVRARSKLNLELARTLAQKEQHIGKVRKAFGKKSVSEKLMQLDTIAKSKSQRQRKLNQVIDQSLWRGVNNLDVRSPRSTHR